MSLGLWMYFWDAAAWVQGVLLGPARRRLVVALRPTRGVDRVTATRTVTALVTARTAEPVT